MSLLSRGLDLAQRYVPAASSGTTVLAYHLVGGLTSTVVDLPLAEFRQQLDWLSEVCEVVSLADALQHAPTSRRRVVITFDDAYRNFMDLAWPELAARRLPAILYVPVGFIEGSAPAPLRGADLPPLSFEQLREMIAGGLTVGSHSVSHHNLRRLPEAQVERELAESRQRLEQELGIPVESFCYPQAKVSRRVARLTARYYSSAVTAGGRPFRVGSRLAIPRFPVRRSEPQFERMVGCQVWLREAVAHQLRQFRP